MLVIDGVISNKPCPYLVFLNNGKTSCKVYNRNRIGRNIGEGNKCHKREDIPVNYRRCSYNRPEWGNELDEGDKIKY